MFILVKSWLQISTPFFITITVLDARFGIVNFIDTKPCINVPSARIRVCSGSACCSIYTLIALFTAYIVQVCLLLLLAVGCIGSRLYNTLCCWCVQCLTYIVSVLLRLYPELTEVMSYGQFNNHNLVCLLLFFVTEFVLYCANTFRVCHTSQFVESLRLE